jgi:hypothetical protein
MIEREIVAEPEIAPAVVEPTDVVLTVRQPIPIRKRAQEIQPDDKREVHTARFGRWRSRPLLFVALLTFSAGTAEAARQHSGSGGPGTTTSARVAMVSSHENLSRLLAQQNVPCRALPS